MENQVTLARGLLYTVKNLWIPMDVPWFVGRLILFVLTFNEPNHSPLFGFQGMEESYFCVLFKHKTAILMI